VWHGKNAKKFGQLKLLCRVCFDNNKQHLFKGLTMNVLRIANKKMYYESTF